MYETTQNFFTSLQEISTNLLTYFCTDLPFLIYRCRKWIVEYNTYQLYVEKSWFTVYDIHQESERL